MGLIAGLGREQVPHGAEHGRGADRSAASHGLGQAALLGGAAHAQRLAVQRGQHRRRTRPRGSGDLGVLVRGAQCEDRAEHPVEVGCHGLGDFPGQAGQVLGGVIGRLLAPVPAGPPDDEADSLRRRGRGRVPRVPEPLQGPRDPGKLGACFLAGLCRFRLDYPAGQLRFAAPRLGQRAQRR